MAQYRKFWLVNSIGNRYDFTSKNSKIFLNQPQGLGFTKNFALSRFGNEEVVDEILYEMPQPSGELLFYKDNNSSIYQDYQDFIQFVKIRPLKFYYQTPNTFDSWYIDCELANIEKSEITQDGIMHCPIVFKGTSFWKTAQTFDLAVHEEITGGKIYDYEYPYTYEGNSFAHITLQNNGTLDCGFDFEINDRITNPVLSLYQEDEKYGEIRILGTYDVIKVNTRDKAQTIYLEYNGSAIANPTSYFDLTGNGQYATPFPKLKVGENVLTFTYGGTFTNDIHIKWQDIFSTI